ncbi:MAG TPA: glutamate-cysteine ligase family protein [Pyrinomonadaceae bacterium]|nr:glutamate-cysteine ligase family protein [Pyrinomonadaceae bacterium]
MSDQLIQTRKNVDAAGCATAESFVLEAEDACAPESNGKAPGNHERVTAASTPLFASYLMSGAKPEANWKCGLEYELFGYDARNLKRLNVEQVQSVLAELSRSTDDLHFEDGAIIEARAGEDGRVTIEPGGQIEFSGEPRVKLSEIERDMLAHLARLREIAIENGFVFIAAGFDPIRTIEEQNWYPKGRYAVMRPFLAARGKRAWDMMCRTCAIQVNLDYGSEKDLGKKFALGNRLAPIVTALFASSPFENGAPSGYKSTRAAVWLETDADRSSVSPAALTENFSFASFVEYALDVPMIFIRRNGNYLPVAGDLSFRRFLEGAGCIEPAFQDWTDHLTTIFTEARIKQHLELRCMDAGSLETALAAQALWKGLMYDATALDEALRIAPQLSLEEMLTLQERVAREALKATHAGVDVLSCAKEIVALAAEGLARVAPEEVKYLDTLRERVIENEVTTADILLQNYQGSWHRSIERVIEYLRIA